MINLPLWFQMANLSYFLPNSNRSLSSCRNGSITATNSTILCANSSTSNSTSRVRDLSHGDIAEITVLSFIFLVSIVANGVLFFAIRRGRKNDKESPGSKLLLNVTLINILLTVFVLPWNICFLAMTYSPISTAWYKFYYMITIAFEVLTKTTWLLVAVISFDRYCAIVRSSYPRILPKKKIKQLPFWLFVSTVVLIALPVTVFCEVEYNEKRHFYAVKRHTWNFFAFDLLYFLIPFATMCFCWGKIFSLAWSKKLKVYLGKVDPPMDPNSQLSTAETSVTDSKHSGIVHFMGLGRLSRSNSRESMSSTDSSVQAPGSRKPSIATTVIYNKSLKAVRTVCVIVGSFLSTVGTYTVSVLMEPFEFLGLRQPEWFYRLSMCLIFASAAVYPLVYGFFNRSIRNNISMLCRSSQSRAQPPPPTGLPRRWSISSHLMDYLPASAISRSNSRRTSADNVMASGSRRRSSASEESDNGSDLSIFRNFLRGPRASKRRESAPSRLQNTIHNTVDGPPPEFILQMQRKHLEHSAVVQPIVSS